MPVTPDRPSRARRAWGETWRILAAAAIGFVGLAFVAWEVDTGQRTVTDAQAALDLLVGVLGLPLLLLRRRAPLTVALVLGAASSVSILVTGAQVVAIVSLATHRRWWKIGVAVVVSVAASWAFGVLHPYADPGAYDWVVDLVAGALGFALLVWIGAYIGLRREHLVSLRERAETAEREQASRVAQARSTERARIAREMHDVLAHRMSLVAMHAGALAYRTDLPPEKIAETAAVVQTNAHAALVELREVLGVLRETEVSTLRQAQDGAGSAADGSTGSGGSDGDVAAGGARRPEPPQPTLGDLDELLGQARASGVEVRLDRRTDRLDELADSVSRHAYRIVQEGLTNARKHAPWAPVTVVVDGAPGEGLALSVRNPVRTVGPEVGPAPPSSSLGLLGLTERAELSGGRLEYGRSDGEFVLEAWLPWAP
ncbi:histidine kinase [Isoptericola hypogeus]|uniref:histidine kinase n=1 Tax=Isoptericola hypogeus TaxID=300179 RepID=A0ABN2JG94_9MICO